MRTVAARPGAEHQAEASPIQHLVHVVATRQGGHVSRELLRPLLGPHNTRSPDNIGHDSSLQMRRDLLARRVAGGLLERFPKSNQLCSGQAVSFGRGVDNCHRHGVHNLIRLTVHVSYLRPRYLPSVKKTALKRTSALFSCQMTLFNHRFLLYDKPMKIFLIFYVIYFVLMLRGLYLAMGHARFKLPKENFLTWQIIAVVPVIALFVTSFSIFSELVAVSCTLLLGGFYLQPTPRISKNILYALIVLSAFMAAVLTF